MVGIVGLERVLCKKLDLDTASRSNGIDKDYWAGGEECFAYKSNLGL